MVNQELLKQQFLCFGVDNLADAVIVKCIELCAIYGVDEEEFVETWMAFTVSNLGGADPSVENLSLLERKELSKRQDAPSTVSKQPQGSLVIYNGNDSAVEPDLNDDILSAYNCTPKAKARPPSRRQDDLTPGRSPRAIFSPASFSPTVATPSTKYKSRINKGNVACSYGDSQKQSDWRPAAHSSLVPQIKVLSKLKDDVCYMYNPLRERMYILDDILECLTEELVKVFSLPEPQDFTQAHQEPFIAVGKVCCDCNGRLNAKSVLLEGSRATCQGRTIPVDVTQVENLSLFPGQVVAMEAENPTGRKLMAKKIFTDIQPPKPAALPTLSVDEGPLQLVIAAGPFTQSDTLTYEPLEDLVEYLKEHEPHAVILTGPFTDSCHPLIVEGNLAETYRALFEKIVDGIMTPLRGLRTQVLLVPSWRDAHHHVVYPTPPYILRKTYPNLLLLPDPGLVDIQGVVVGITSTDVLFHLGKEEISKTPIASDRLGRLASHILLQRSFYPLYPPAEEMSVDLDLWAKHTSLNVTPHIIVLPSDLRYFIKNLNGCIVVNPERLAKGMVGGNFARLEISAPFTDADISNNIKCEIVKI